ncbi:telomere regulation protein Stn1-domain-containing protein [Limtongia smithiae]|uniref:telomere regulation protein Stn1-domain-containing protein n=1 Tax=Limtongia smithiae TaxID=1125753 RepID=UPI0034CE30C7
MGRFARAASRRGHHKKQQHRPAPAQGSSNPSSVTTNASAHVSRIHSCDGGSPDIAAPMFRHPNAVYLLRMKELRKRSARRGGDGSRGAVATGSMNSLDVGDAEGDEAQQQVGGGTSASTSDKLSGRRRHKSRVRRTGSAEKETKPKQVVLDVEQFEHAGLLKALDAALQDSDDDRKRASGSSDGYYAVAQPGDANLVHGARDKHVPTPGSPFGLNSRAEAGLLSYLRGGSGSVRISRSLQNRMSDNIQEPVARNIVRITALPEAPEAQPVPRSLILEDVSISKQDTATMRTFVRRCPTTELEEQGVLYNSRPFDRSNSVKISHRLEEAMRDAEERASNPPLVVKRNVFRFADCEPSIAKDPLRLPENVVPDQDTTEQIVPITEAYQPSTHENSLLVRESVVPFSVQDLRPPESVALVRHTTSWKAHIPASSSPSSLTSSPQHHASPTSPIHHFIERRENDKQRILKSTQQSHRTEVMIISSQSQLQCDRDKPISTTTAVRHKIDAPNALPTKEIKRRHDPVVIDLGEVKAADVCVVRAKTVKPPPSVLLPTAMVISDEDESDRTKNRKTTQTPIDPVAATTADFADVNSLPEFYGIEGILNSNSGKFTALSPTETKFVNFYHNELPFYFRRYYALSPTYTKWVPMMISAIEELTAMKIAGRTDYFWKNHPVQFVSVFGICIDLLVRDTITTVDIDDSSGQMISCVITDYIQKCELRHRVPPFFISVYGTICDKRYRGRRQLAATKMEIVTSPIREAMFWQDVLQFRKILERPWRLDEKDITEFSSRRSAEEAVNRTEEELIPADR